MSITSHAVRTACMRMNELSRFSASDPVQSQRIRGILWGSVAHKGDKFRNSARTVHLDALVEYENGHLQGVESQGCFIASSTCLSCSITRSGSQGLPAAFSAVEATGLLAFIGVKNEAAIQA